MTPAERQAIRFKLATRDVLRGLVNLAQQRLLITSNPAEPYHRVQLAKVQSPQEERPTLR